MRSSDYKLKHDLRIQKLNEKLKASALKPRALTDKEEWEREQAGYETVDDDDETAKEGAADKKEGGASHSHSPVSRSPGRVQRRALAAHSPGHSPRLASSH